jgi:hypothetical protein
VKDEKGRGGEGMKTKTHEQTVRENIETVLYNVECGDYDVALDWAIMVVEQLRSMNQR